MKDRRGEADGISAFIVAIIAISVLSIVGLGYYLYQSDTIRNIDNLIPGFNLTQQEIEKFEIVRYDIVDDKVQWYDGTEWQEFQSDKIRLGSKSVSGNSLRNRFQNYWYGEREAISIKEYRIPADSSRVFMFRESPCSERTLEPEVIRLEESPSDELGRGYVKLGLDNCGELALSYNDFLHKATGGSTEEAKEVGVIRAGTFDMFITDKLSSFSEIEKEKIMFLNGQNYVSVINGGFSSLGYTSNCGYGMTSCLIYYENETLLRISNPYSANEDKKLFGYPGSLVNYVEFSASDFEAYPKAKDLISVLSRWRDSIVKGGNNTRALNVNYDGGEVTVCVEKIGNRYLWIDLREEVDGDGDCK